MPPPSTTVPVTEVKKTVVLVEPSIKAEKENVKASSKENARPASATAPKAASRSESIENQALVSST